MTRKGFPGQGTPFSFWLREEYQKFIGSHRFSCQNLDYVWHDYRANWFILIEEKQFGGMKSWNAGAKNAQDDTHGVVDQMLKIASPSMVQTLFRGMKEVEYKGYFYIVFNESLPPDGLTINGHIANEAILVDLLMYGELRLGSSW